MELSSEVKQVKPSATLAINELTRIRHARGEELLHMGFGESPFPVHASIKEALCKNADKKGYLSPQGILPLREAISDFYRIVFELDYPSERIILGPGSKILIYAALLALEGPLFLPAPSWVSYPHQANLAKKDFQYVETFPRDSYRLTPEALLQKIDETNYSEVQQKLLLLNYPNNPTGHTYSVVQLKNLASAARENNIIIISDEIYGLITYGEERHRSIAEFYPEGTIVTGGMSKDRSLGGYRVGAMLVAEGEADLVRSMSSIASETWSCLAAPVQYAATEGYSTNPKLINYIKDCASIHEIMTQYVYQRLIDARIRCPCPEGAFYVFPDWNRYSESLSDRGIVNSTELAKHLLTEHGVVTLPGSEFGMHEKDLCLRLASVDYDGSVAFDCFREEKPELQDEYSHFVNQVAPHVVAACDQLESFTESLG